VAETNLVHVKTLGDDAEVGVVPGEEARPQGIRARESSCLLVRRSAGDDRASASSPAFCKALIAKNARRYRTSDPESSAVKFSVPDCRGVRVNGPPVSRGPSS
jgi:hypothetical protein